MNMTGERPGTRKLILLGAAVAIPLAAVALYFALFDQPPPRQSAPPSRAPSEPGNTGQAALPPDHPLVGGQTGPPQAGASPTAPASHPQVGGASRPVRVPEGVKGKWQAVKLQVVEKAGGKEPRVFTVRLGGQLEIPGSKLRVRVGEFLPALQVSGNEVTSASNDPTNPAVLVTVSDEGKETFKGWLFSKFPDMQPFEHPTYRITLVEGVPGS